MTTFIVVLALAWVALAWFVSGLAVRNGSRRLPWLILSLICPFVTVFWFSWIEYLRARAEAERRARERCRPDTASPEATPSPRR